MNRANAIFLERFSKVCAIITRFIFEKANHLRFFRNANMNGIMRTTLTVSIGFPIWSKRFIMNNPAKSVLKTKLILYLVPVTWIDPRSLVDRIYVDDFLPFRL